MANIPKTMLAWQKHRGTNKAVKVEVPVPSAPADGVLVKIHAAGVCHSDFGLLNAEQFPPYYLKEYTLGHEGCGEIVQVGEKVTSEFNVGDMVAILSVPGCGASDCPECSRGLTQICSRGEHYGLGHHGSYAPYVAVHARAAIPLPQGVSPASGAVATDAVMTAYHAVNHIGNVQKDETIVIFGLGGLGFNALQIALAIGSKIYVVDNRPEILEEAIKFGVQRDNAISSAEAFTELVTSKDIVIDTAIDFVGKRETFASAQDTVRYSGNIVLVGLLSSELTLNSLTCIRKQLKILCSYGGRAQDLKECLKLIASGSITPQVETGPLSELPRILDDLHHGKIKSRIALIPDW